MYKSLVAGILVLASIVLEAILFSTPNVDSNEGAFAAFIIFLLPGVFGLEILDGIAQKEEAQAAIQYNERHR